MADLGRVRRERQDHLGGDPVGVVFDPKDVVLKVGSGNYYREPA